MQTLSRAVILSLAVTLLAWSQTPPPGKSKVDAPISKQQQNGGDQNNTPSDAPVVADPIQPQNPKNKGATQAGQGKENEPVRVTLPVVTINEPKDGYDKSLFVLTVLLFIAGVYQIHLLRVGTEATRVAANAALQSMEIMKAKERARVKISFDTPSLDLQFTEGRLHWSITNHGGVASAFITKARARLLFAANGGVSEQTDLSEFSLWFSEFGNAPLKPSDGHKSAIPILPNPGPEGLQQLRNQERILWAYGLIEYTDAFGSWHSKCRLRLVVLPDFVSETLTARWACEGKPEDNEET